MNPELAALLAAIRTNPEDDLPRLALADWCQEQADPSLQARGEFVHLRCCSAVLPPEAPQRALLEHRARDLRLEHEMAWLEGLATLLVGWEFERGCVLVHLAAGSIRRNSLERLARTPGWAWVIGLRGIFFELDDITALARSSHLDQLSSLDLRDGNFGPAGVERLVESSFLPRLAALHLDYARLGDHGATSLAEAPGTKRLTTLSLSNNGIGSQGTEDLAHSPHLGELVCLDLSRNPMGDAGARAVAGSRILTASLRELGLSSCGLTNRSGVILASARHLEGLQRLDLANNAFNEATRMELRERFGARVRL